jgi:probable rRNA maturation factor
MSITIINNQKVIKIPLKKTRLFIEKVIEGLLLPGSTQISFIFAGRPGIKKLNKRYFKTTRATDVIALRYKNTHTHNVYKEYLGDVIICPEVARVNAKLFRKSFIYELYLYIVHGTLHLLGYSDTSARAAAKMKRIQERVLKTACKSLKIKI